MLLMGTKVDIANTNPTRRQVTLKEAESLVAAKHMVGVVETSAKEDTNISSTFLELATRLKEKYDRVGSIVETEESIKLNTFNVTEKKSCFC